MEWGKITSIFQMPFANMGLLVITYNCFNLNMMICSCSSKLLWIHWFYRRKSWKKLSKVLSSLKQLSHIIIHFSFAQNSPKYWDLYWKLVAALYLTACKVVDNISSDQSLWLSSWELRKWSHLPLIQAHFKCHQHSSDERRRSLVVDSEWDCDVLEFVITRHSCDNVQLMLE